jgi:hypothetical protein
MIGPFFFVLPFGYSDVVLEPPPPPPKGNFPSHYVREILPVLKTRWLRTEAILCAADI